MFITYNLIIPPSIMFTLIISTSQTFCELKFSNFTHIVSGGSRNEELCIELW